MLQSSDQAVFKIMRQILHKTKNQFRGMLALNFLGDYLRFRSRWVGKKKLEKLNIAQARSILLKWSHALEKGLSLPDQRQHFGEAKAVDLICFLSRYIARFGPDDYAGMAASVLTSYFTNSRNSYSSSMRSAMSEAKVSLDLILQSVDQFNSMKGGTHTVSRAEIQRAVAFDYATFVRSRHSVRYFTGECVDKATLVDAIRLAQKCPSVCNRSSGRVYISTDSIMMDRLLSHQNGNRGFGHKAGAVIVVAADLRTFHTAGERNQAWIDGGLFAMSIAFALHAKCLGVCMLNWSKTIAEDQRFKNEIGISKDYAIIMLMVVGKLPDVFPVAASPRPPLSEIVISLDGDPSELFVLKNNVVG